MAGKGRKPHHVTEEGTEDGGELTGSVKTILEMFMESQARAEQSRREEQDRVEQMRREDKIAEERRKEDRIAEEEKAERREEAKRVRKLEEAQKAEDLARFKQAADLRVAEEAERAKEEAARVAAERLCEMQREASDRAHEQQVQLVKMQIEMGAKSAEAHRLEVDRSRMRDRAISALAHYRDQDDVEDFLLTSERKLRAGEIPEAEWVAIIASKLGGRAGCQWQELCMTVEGYEEVKSEMLRVFGYTPKLAGESFYGFRSERLRGMTADQLYRRGTQLLRRMLGAPNLSARREFALLKPWVYSIVSRKARSMIDSRSVTTSGELIEVLQDYLVTEGDRTEGHAAVFKGQAQVRESVREHFGNEKKAVSVTCFKCGKPGHKAADCWQKGVAPPSGSSKSVSGSVGTPTKVVCYTCGVEGHKSTSCPVKQEKVNPKEGQAKPVRQLGARGSGDALLKGLLEGVEASIILDSGAAMSIVPESMVKEKKLTGEVVLLRAFQSKVAIKLPTAKVLFEIGTLSWEEMVAVAPVEVGRETEVLYGLDLRSDRGWELALMARGGECPSVGRVTTRSETVQETLRKRENAEVVAHEKPVVKAVVVDPAREEPVKDRSDSTGKGDPVADRPAGDPEPVASEHVIEDDEEGLVGLDFLDGEEEAELEEEARYCIRTGGKDREDLVIPPVQTGSCSRSDLVREVKSDPSLAQWRSLGDRGEQGFSWQRELLYKATTTHTLELIHLMVLPVNVRKRVLHLAHERSGHLGPRKVKALIKQRFAWPGMGQQIIEHCRSCETCQRCSKTKSRKVPMMERQVLSEPFEVLAFDLVGPFPKGKGGYMYVLTAICMSSRWPEAVPLKSITARAVNWDDGDLQ